MVFPTWVTPLLLVVVCGSYAHPTQDTEINAAIRRRRVAGGYKVDITYVPYQARIDYPDGMCGATIIHPSYVITAKHCLKGRDPKTARVVAGGRGGRGELSRFVRRAVPFPDRQREEERHLWLPRDLHRQSAAVMGDIALLQVEPPWPVDREEEIGPVPLQTQREFSGGRCFLSGWGITQANATTHAHSPPRLHAAEVEVYPRDKCLSLEKRLKADFLCAGKPNGSARGRGGIDACDGDSGGPLVCNGELTGVVKGGRGCGEAANVSKYSEVALFAPWIASVIGVPLERIGHIWHHA